jgi:hypothetical protein
MGEGDKRQSQRVVRDERRDLERTEAADKLALERLLADPPALASRTATLDDPLTTMLLAEASRRSMTIEVSPDDVAHIVDAPPDDPADDDWDD